MPAVGFPTRIFISPFSMSGPVSHMANLMDAFEDIAESIDEMLVKISEAIDLLEKENQEEATEILMEVEDELMDFLGYPEEGCECEECEEEEEVEEKEVKKKSKKEKHSKKK